MIITDFNNYQLTNNYSSKKYNYKPDNLKKIIGCLTQAKETMINPIAAHYVIYTNYDFKTKTLIERIKRILGNTSSLFFYSIEQTLKQMKYKTVHFHLCLIIDVPMDDNENENEIFDMVLSNLQKLKNVDSSYTHEAKNIKQRLWN